MADVEPQGSAANECHKHDGDDGLCVHSHKTSFPVSDRRGFTLPVIRSSSLFFLLPFNPKESQNARTDGECRRKAHPEGGVEVIACFRGVTEFVVHMDDGGGGSLGTESASA